MLNVFAVGHFSESYEPTVFDNYVTEIELDGKPVQLALWDTAGQEEYERLRPLSYSKAHVILIAFAVDTPDSLENVTQKWIEEVRSICGKAIPVILVACKTDLRDKAVANGTYSPERFTDHATVRLPPSLLTPPPSLHSPLISNPQISYKTANMGLFHLRAKE